MADKSYLETDVTIKVMYNQNPMAMMPWHTDHFNDAFVQVEEVTVQARPDGDMDAWYRQQCEDWFRTLNPPEREDLRSMSVGDHVVFEFGDSTVSYRCAGEGWEKVM